MTKVAAGMTKVALGFDISFQVWLSVRKFIIMSKLYERRSECRKVNYYQKRIS